MYILIEGSEILDSASHGVHHTTNAPIIIRNTVIRNSQGCGFLSGEPDSPHKPKGIHADIPEDVDRVALGKLLKAIIEAGDVETKKELVKPKGSLLAALKSGEAAASLAEKVLNLANNPAIQKIIESLLKP